MYVQFYFIYFEDSCIIINMCYDLKGLEMLERRPKYKYYNNVIKVQNKANSNFRKPKYLICIHLANNCKTNIQTAVDICCGLKWKDWAHALI